MSQTYTSIKSLHSSSPSFKPPIPTSLLPYIACITLVAFFALTFTFTTFSKSKTPIPEIGTAVVASALAGAGVVALFCAVGVYV